MSLARIVPTHAGARPDAVALVDGDREVRYGELGQRVEQLAAVLAGAGLRSGDRVVTLLPSRAECFEVLFACARLGLVLVPAAAQSSEAELRGVVDDCRAACLIHDASLAAAASARVAGALGGPRLCIEVAGDPAAPGVYERLLLAADPAGVDVDAVPEPATPLLLLSTAGTTGPPKRVILTHGNVLATSVNQIVDWGLRGDDRVLAVAPLWHVGGLLALSFPCLHVGGTVVVERDPQAVVATIERWGVTALFLPPVAWNELADDELAGRDLDTVRLCVTGGEPMRRDRVRRLVAAFGADFTCAYGLTEAASCATFVRPPRAVDRPESVGTPFIHTELRVVDERGTPVADGDVGEVLLRGPTVMRGYWGEPEATAEALRGGWLHTGDLGRVDDDGLLTLVGRTGDVIVSRGATIYPSEVERALNVHPAIVAAAVVGVPDERAGELVAAAVQPRAGARVDPGELLDHCRALLAHELVPALVVTCAALPRNANGKVVKAALRAIVGERIGHQHDRVAPE